MKKPSRPIRAAAGGAPIRLAATIEIQAAAADRKVRTFQMRAYNGGLIEVAGYYLPVVIDLAGLGGVGKSVPILKDHDPAQVVGHGKAHKADGGLELAGDISGTGPAAVEVLANADNGFPWQASVGVQPARGKLVEVEAGRTASVNGRTVAGPCYVIRKSSLREVSVLALGADADTRVSIAAHAAQPKEVQSMDYEQWLEGLGLTLAGLPEEAQARLKAKYDAEQAPPSPEPPPPSRSGPAAADETPETIRARRAAESAEVKRIEKIRAICASYRNDELHAVEAKELAEIEAQALEEGWEAQATELALLKAARPKAPPVHAPGRRDFSAPAIEAALCRSAGLRNLERHFPPAVLEAADAHRNLGLQELLLIQANANGYSGRQRISDANLREVLSCAFPLRAAAPFSTVAVPGILSNVANKFLLAGFEAVEQVWREIAAIRSVSDFKTVTSYRMNGAMQYLEVGPTGELKHDSVAEESYTIAASTYGRMFAVSRRDIINDDLGAFDDVQRRLGRGAGLALNEKFWSVFLDNTAFFTAGRANLATSSALAEATLGTAVQKFRDMTDADGKPMALNPVLLLVPTALESAARKLYVATEMRDTTASTKYPVANIYQNAYRPVVSTYLANSTMGGAYSATTWYLLSSPADMPVMEVCFLNGQQSPTVESADADFATLGIQFRGYHDFGVALKEYRGAVKCTA